ncbi:hypothetical protein QEN19_002415 [Hanseniaspora menglaensis]
METHKVFEETAFGDFVDHVSSNNSHHERINVLFDELLLATDKEAEEDSNEEFFSGPFCVFDSLGINKERCKTIYKQLFQHSPIGSNTVTDSDSLSEHLNQLFHQSITYNHLIQVLNINLDIDEKKDDIASPHTILKINNLTEKVVLFIKELQIHSIDDDSELYFNELKSKYTSLIVNDNEHLSILTDPHIFNLTLDLIKQKIETQNLIKDNEVYNNIVSNFIEQSQRTTRNKLKQHLAK